jgi:hypothetical protein
MDVSVYHMRDKHGTQDVAICKTHAKKAFPKGIGGEPYPTAAEPAENGIACEFCPPRRKP